MEMKVNKVNTLTKEFLHMNAGNGEFSYAQNSSLQKRSLEHVKPLLEECILSMELIESNTFCIADLGCSSGPNALLPAENIIRSLQTKYISAGNIPVPQFQVFLNDLPSSDFNTLFRTLHPVITDRNDPRGAEPARSYFPAGVAGSFYERLFPDKSLHFVHSSFSLHWLSQVPPEVLDKNSVTWNKGKISAGGSPAVGEAYFHQFQKDFNQFLRVRAKEMVGGGRMFLLFMGRTSRDPTDQGFIALCWESLESSLNDLVSQGLIEEEKVDTFNLPLFWPCREEVSSEVAREGSFLIQRLELVKSSEMFSKEEMAAMAAMRGSASAKGAQGNIFLKQIRPTLESLLKYHFGNEVMEALFEGYGETMAKRVTKSIENIENRADEGFLTLVLERK